MRAWSSSMVAQIDSQREKRDGEDDVMGENAEKCIKPWYLYVGVEVRDSES